MGRPLTLTYRQKIVIGATCERLWRAECQKEEKAAFEAAHRFVDVEWRKAREARQRGEPLPYYHEEDVGFALAVDQGLDPEGHEEPSRVIAIVPKRPWGKRGPIMAKIAPIATRHYGKEITTRMVDKCWKLFRALEDEQNDLALDDATS